MEISTLSCTIFLPQQRNDYLKNPRCNMDKKFKMTLIYKINLCFPSKNDLKTSHNYHNYKKIVECLSVIKYLNCVSPSSIISMHVDQDGVDHTRIE